MFMSHAADATWITGSMEHRGSRIKDMKFAFMSRAATSWDVLRVAGIIGEELRKKKVSDKVL